MNLKKYETFLRVAELKSLTRAAESLGCTQSAVSHVINSLEEEFGFSLLSRNRAGAELTADGERLLPAIRAVLNADEQLRQTVASVRGLDEGIVRIGTFSSVGVHWLPSMIKSFRQDYPHIQFKLMNGDYSDVENWLAEGSIDLGFVRLPSASGFACVPLMEDRLLAVLPPDHPLAAQREVTVEALREEPFISLLAASDQDVRRAMDLVGISPQVAFETKDDYAIIAMVANGLGVSIMPELLLKGHGDTVAVRPLFPNVQRVIGLALPPSLSPAAARFAEHVKNWEGFPSRVSGAAQ